MDRTKKISKMVNLRVWAIVGASNHPNKFGHKIYHDLKQAGYKVYPINPSEEQIGGDRCYATVSELPEVPDVVNLVVPPAVAYEVVGDCARARVKHVWFQPGADSIHAIQRAQQAGMEVVHDACIMVEKKRWELSSQRASVD